MADWDWTTIYLTGFMLTLTGLIITADRDRIGLEAVGASIYALLWPFFWAVNIYFFVRKLMRP